MRRVGGLVPKTSAAAKQLAAEVRTTHMLYRGNTRQVFMALAPY